MGTLALELLRLMSDKDQKWNDEHGEELAEKWPRLCYGYWRPSADVVSGGVRHEHRAVQGVSGAVKQQER